MDIEIESATNENGDGYTPEDGIYVRDYMEKMLAHFRECKISPAAIAIGLVDTMFANAPGCPYDKLEDQYEGDIWAGLSVLWPAEARIQNRVKAYLKVLDRIENAREARNVQGAPT